MKFLIHRASEYTPISKYKLAEAGFKFEEIKLDYDEDYSAGVIEIDNLSDLIRLNDLTRRLVIGKTNEHGLTREITIYDDYLE